MSDFKDEFGQGSAGLGDRITGADIHVMLGYNKDDKIVTPDNQNKVEDSIKLVKNDTAKTLEIEFTAASKITELEGTTLKVTLYDYISVKFDAANTNYPTGFRGDIRKVDKTGKKITIGNVVDPLGNPLTLANISTAVAATVYHTNFIALPHEVSSGLTVNASFGEIIEKGGAFKRADAAVPLPITQTYDQRYAWQVDVSLYDGASSSNIIRQLVNFYLQHRDQYTSIRLILDRDCAGYQGIVRPRPSGGIPDSVGTDDIAMSNMTLHGIGPLRVVAPILAIE